jgi:hypothetical protein
MGHHGEFGYALRATAADMGCTLWATVRNEAIQ